MKLEGAEMGLGNFIILLAVVAVVAGVLGASGLAGPLTWPVMGVGMLAVLLLLTTAFISLAGGEELFK
jgi:uncharacterized membrane protein YtjA (UPF0391 family)